MRKKYLVLLLVPLLIAFAGCGKKKYVAPPPAPSAPSNLSGNAVSSTQIDLAWQDNSTNEKGFYVYRKITGNYARVAIMEANANSYSNSGLDPETSYWYKVKAYNDGGDSGWSNEVNIRTPAGPGPPPPPELEAPSTLSANVVSYKQINLSWQDNSDSEDGFRVRCNIGHTRTKTIATVGPDTIRYEHCKLQPVTDHKYYIEVFRGYKVAEITGDLKNPALTSLEFETLQQGGCGVFSFTLAEPYKVRMSELKEESLLHNIYPEGVSCQGVATDGTYIYITTHTIIYKCLMDGTILDSHANANLAGTDMPQINHVHLFNGKLYIGACNAFVIPKLGYIKVFDADTLDYIEEHRVLDHWSEGCAHHDDHFWVVYIEYSYVSKYDINWNHIADYQLSYTKTGPSVGMGYSGITWKSNDIFCPISTSMSPSPCVDRYHWSGSAFTEVARLSAPELVGEGLCYLASNDRFYLVQENRNVTITKLSGDSIDYDWRVEIYIFNPQILFYTGKVIIKPDEGTEKLQTYLGYGYFDELNKKIINTQVNPGNGGKHGAMAASRGRAGISK